MRQCNLYQRISKKEITSALLFGLIKKLSQRKKYLEACIDYAASLKAYHYLSQKQSREANNYFFCHWQGFINGQAKSWAYDYQAKT